MLAPGTVVSLRHYFHKITSVDLLKTGPRTSVMGYLDPLWETHGGISDPDPVAQPSSCMHVPTKPIVSKARPAPVVRVPIVCLYVLQVLNL